MGHVYRARHFKLAKDVAIKIIHKQFVSDETAIKRFNREAKAAAHLIHPNIIQVYDIDETKDPDPRPYIVMEFVDGKTLKEVLADEQKLTIDRALTLFLDICRGVSYAHQQGVIHRDIKPGNIMIIQRKAGAGDTVKILDFGLAKMRESDDQSAITQIGTVMGTPVYMSPEQCRGEELDARSDVYSLATVLFEMISGVPPFSGSNVYTKHQFEPVPCLDSSLKASTEIVEVINRGLAKNREDRPADAQAFSDALQSAYAQLSESRGAAVAVDQQSTTVDQASENLAGKSSSSTQIDSSIVQPLIEVGLQPPDHQARIDWYDLRLRVHNAGELILRDFDVEVTIPRSHTPPDDSSVLLQHNSQGDARHYRLMDKPQSVLPGHTTPILMQLMLMVPWDDYTTPPTENVSVAVFADDRCVGKKNFPIDDLLKPDRRDYIQSNKS